MYQKPLNFLPPWLAGIGLGLTLFAMFLFTGHGLGAYGFFRDLGFIISAELAPDWAAANAYIAPYLKKSSDFFSRWMTWQIIGLVLGALLSSLLFRRFAFTIERGAHVSIAARLVYALLGGILTGFGAALAGGCTSGLGLSGGAVLAVGAFLFLAAFFVAGILLSIYTRRIWQ